MLITECRVGMEVNFGRGRGEKTLGRITKVNRTKCKVEQLEARGTRKSHNIGSIWTVPPSLMTPADASATPAAPSTPAAPKRPEADILRDIGSCYGDLSPENLTCDGELSASAVRRKAAGINRHLRALFTELGREVSEGEAYNLIHDLPPSTEDWMDAMVRRQKARQPKDDRTTDSSVATSLGLPADLVGQSFKVKRTTYTVTGVTLRNHKYPVLATTQTGKRYKLDVPFVLKGLGLTTTPAAPSAPKTGLTDLPADIVGRTFKSRRRTYKVTEINRRRPKYPVSATRLPDGKRFKFPINTVLTGLLAA